MIQESTILLIQFGATLFMATDYFLRKEQQDSVSAAIQKVVQPIQDNIDSDIQGRVDYVIRQWAGIVIACLFVAAAWIGVHAMPLVAPGLEPWAVGVATIFFLMLFAGGMPKITEVIVQAVIPLTMASSMRLVTSFLLRCPKGTVFGIGFLLLLVAFLCRYLNLK